MICSHSVVLCCAMLCCAFSNWQSSKLCPHQCRHYYVCFQVQCLSRLASGPQTGRDSLTDLPPPRTSSSVPAATLSASLHLAAQKNLSHGLSPPNLNQLPSELPLKQSMSHPSVVTHPPAMTHPPAVTHPPTAGAQQLPAKAAAPRSSLKLSSQLPSQLPS